MRRWEYSISSHTHHTRTSPISRTRISMFIILAILLSSVALLAVAYPIIASSRTSTGATSHCPGVSGRVVGSARRGAPGLARAELRSQRRQDHRRGFRRLRGQPETHRRRLAAGAGSSGRPRPMTSWTDPGAGRRGARGPPWPPASVPARPAAGLPLRTTSSARPAARAWLRCRNRLCRRIPAPSAAGRSIRATASVPAAASRCPRR